MVWFGAIYDLFWYHFVAGFIAYFYTVLGDCLRLDLGLLGTDFG